ncbi:hypothetical protein, partial [Achromobacter kerstersii]
AESVQPFMRRVAAVEGGAVARAIGMGKTLIKAGGVIATLGGVADGVGSIETGIRVGEAGDTKSKKRYFAGGLLAIIGGGFSAHGAATSGALFGSLGLGIVLGLAAFIVIATAKRQESTALEHWARRSYFGRGSLDRRWAHPEQMDSAICALNAAVLGVEASLGFHSAKRPMDIDVLMTTDILLIKETGGIESGTELGCRIVLPGFDSARSCYEFTLYVERFGVEKGGRRTPVITSFVLASAHHNSARAATSPGEVQDMTPQTVILPSNENPVLSRRYWLEAMHATKAATLEISYWPDKDDVAGYARLWISEEA